jgi:hypothetical protein
MARVVALARLLLDCCCIPLFIVIYIVSVSAAAVVSLIFLTWQARKALAAQTAET